MPPATVSRSIVASSLVLLAAAGCHLPAESTTATTAMVPISSGSGGYAAMDEVPVFGGELRLSIEMPLPDDVAYQGATGPAIAFPLRHTAVHAEVAGMMAIYTVEQTFENPYDQVVEAVYVFPMGDEAAVSSYAITIGERTIVGEIQTRAQARQTYQTAQAEGRTAALLEQDVANVFSQRIANIAPRETIKVRFQYAELVDVTEGVYQLAFPLVVGPRYLPATGVGRHPVESRVDGAIARTGTTSVPYVDASIAGSTVSFTADIDAGVPISGIESPSHDLEVDDVSTTRSHVELAHADEVPNRDLVLRYRAGGDRTMVGVLAHRDGDDGYFVLVVQPKESYRTGDIAPREVILLLDTSGSMEGAPLQQAREVAGAILASLGDRDTFNVLAFSDGVTLMSERPVRGDADGKRAGRAFLDGLTAGGGTAMDQAMVDTLSLPAAGERLRMVYLLSDGFVGNDDMVIEGVRGVLGHNRVFPVGIGSAPNRYLMDRLGEAGRGFTSYLGLTEAAASLAPDLVRRSAFPYMTDIEINWDGLKVTDVTPLAIPDVYAGSPLIISGRYLAAGTGTIEVAATTGGRRMIIPLEVTLPERTVLPPVGHLWARRRIEALLSRSGAGGPDASTARSITALGLQFGLVTEFTSYVAVDRTRVVVGGGKTKLVEQPAAIPEGVNLDSAVGYGYQEPAYASSGGGSSSSYDSTSGGYSSGGWSGGGDVDPLTLLLAIGLLPLAWSLRRTRRA